MILPDKNIKLQYSLLACGALLLSLLKTPQTFSSLWEKAKKHDTINNYDKFLLTLDFLYLINAIELQDGFLVRGKNASFNK